MATPVTVIVLSPVGNLAPGQGYYSVASEFPQENSALQTMQRFLLYPWAYNTNPIGSFVQPPA